MSESGAPPIAAALPPVRRRVLDVSALPDYAFGHQGLIWWGTVGFMVIEGSLFIMAMVTYFVFRTRVDAWPPAQPNPDAIVWFIMGLHSAHLLTDVVDSAVLLALMYTRHVEPKRFVDVSENSLYWYFIVLSWIPVYVTIYFAPRWL